MKRAEAVQWLLTPSWDRSVILKVIGHLNYFSKYISTIMEDIEIQYNNRQKADSLISNIFQWNNILYSYNTHHILTETF